ncbi:hypothetical protein VTI74DRAFT_7024 [Chaetomium olivicolor]
MGFRVEEARSEEEVKGLMRMAGVHTGVESVGFCTDSSERQGYAESVLFVVINWLDVLRWKGRRPDELEVDIAPFILEFS